jgi:hypothetical protein
MPHIFIFLCCCGEKLDEPIQRRKRGNGKLTPQSDIPGFVLLYV